MRTIKQILRAVIAVILMTAVSSVALAQQKDTAAAPADSSVTPPPPDPAAFSSLPSYGPNSFLYAAELGGRSFSKEPSALARAKLEEYKALPEGAVLLQLLANYTAHDSITVFQVNGTNFGQRDQTLRFRGNSPGRYDLQVRWDRIPHTFSTNARSLGSQTSPDVFVLPNPRPDTTAWKISSPYLSPVRTLWSTVRAAAFVTPSPKFDLRTEYLNIRKTGSRPIGMAFGSPGNNLREILEPIDQTMQDIKLTNGYANDRFQVLGSYDLSLFNNKYRSVTSDNPLLITDTPTGGSSRGRVSLAPTNHAHTGTVNAALNLPRRTRINANGSYSLWVQDEMFIPVTINSAIVKPAGALPQRLGGHSGTSMFSLSGVSRPIDPLTLTARFRTFSFRDRVDADTVPYLIVNDRSISAGTERESLPFTRRNADAGATWRIARIPVTLSAGIGWERWKRSEARNVADLRETSPRVSADFGIFDWM
jgi:hypothetical protein